MSTTAIPAMLAVALTLGLAACGSGRPETARQADIDGNVHLCSSCHGITGRSVSPNFPVLAGQQAEYLSAQLHAFRDHSRADPHAHTYMWGMAAHLDDTAIDGLAAYFARQPLGPGAPADADKAAVAQPIFTLGIDSRNVPACIACHGDKAEGQGAIPRLAGQHRDYLAEQLRLFRSNSRANETMHENALNLTEPEIDALAEYLAGL